MGDNSFFYCIGLVIIGLMSSVLALIIQEMNQTSKLTLKKGGNMTNNNNFMVSIALMVSGIMTNGISEILLP